jgi:hypothetical protein
MGRRATSKKKPTVYIETTIPSYLTSRRAKDIDKIYKQQVTQEWWEKALPLVEPVISTYVLEEVSGGDPEAAKRRIESLKGFRLLPTTDEVSELASELRRKLKIPERARIDSFHLAIAVVYRVDYVLSWNFEHIVGAPVKRTFAEIGQELDLVMPTLCTPDELMEV